MRKGWEYKRLDECANIEYGTRVVQKKDSGTLYPVYGGGGETFRMDKFNREDCLIVARFAMSRRCVRFVNGKFFLNDSGLSVKAGDKLYQSYLNYNIISLNDDIYHLGKGAAQRNLDVKSFKKLTIAIPPKSTQLAIVTELDKINELIRLKKEQLKDFDNLAQSLFYEMFGDPVENEKGWEVKKIKDIATEKLSYGSGASAVPFNKSVRYIRITDINEYGELKDEKVSPNIFDEKYLLAEGDILFARSGATVGKTYLHKQNEIPCIYAGYLIRLRPNELLVLPNYVYYYTKSNYYKSFICANQRVVAQPNINAKQYGDLDIPLPPLSLQRLFAQRIEQIEREKSEVQKSIQDLETLLASRMQYWFE